MKYRITLEVNADAPWGNEPPLDDLAGWSRYLDSLTPAQAERLAGALVKAATWVRVRR